MIVAAFCATALGLAPSAGAATLPANFKETAIFSGLNQPTSVRFAPAPDSRVFVTEKSGIIKVFENLSDPLPTIFADFRTKTYNGSDRGFESLAVHPNFPATPQVFVLYSHDAAIGGTAPRWGTPGADSDSCPYPKDGCPISGRLSKLTVDLATNKMSGGEQVLIEDWCQQYTAHSVGDLAFGADGKLYASAGDGASAGFADYGQGGGSSGSPVPANPCGDPPGGVGTPLTSPTAEGGALRSQDLRTTADPTGLSGTLLRLDPATGAAASDNPLAGSSDVNRRRIVASGLRNPFRFTIRPGTSDVWIGDVGWGSQEEINRVDNPLQASPRNFGWPCYEGISPQGGYKAVGLNICNNLYAQSGAVTPPWLTYSHWSQVVAGESCPTGGSSISALTFYRGGPYPDAYDGALFFADYVRGCIWAVRKGTDGLPDRNLRETFVTGAATPVDLQVGPGGDLFYVDIAGGTIRRITYGTTTTNRPPVAAATATPANGPVPLAVSFSASGSSDPDGDALTYSWDLDGNGTFGDAAGVTASRTYTAAGDVNVGLRVTDARGASATTTVRVTAGGNPPVARIDLPSATTRWNVDQVIQFAGSATDREQGSLPGSALAWRLTLQHCPDNVCHAHVVSDATGASGSFNAPDHDFPSHLELTLTATDASGLKDSKTVRLDPNTVNLTLASSPAGLKLGLNSEAPTAPFTRRAIVGSTNTVSAPSPQSLSGVSYVFDSFSDGGSQSHTITAPATDTTLTASFRPGGTNRPPTIVATASPSSGPVPLFVYFSAIGSSDPDGDTISYGWDLNGDGLYGDASWRTASLTYSTSGVVNAGVKVTDSRGAYTIKTLPISVGVTAPENRPPVAVAAASPSSGTAPLAVSFSAAGSSDPDGDGLAYAWDLDANGSFEAAGASVSRTYTEAGTYTATVKVTDSKGLSASKNVTVTVSAPTGGTNRPPDVAATASPSSGPVPLAPTPTNPAPLPAPPDADYLPLERGRSATFRWRNSKHMRRASTQKFTVAGVSSNTARVKVKSTSGPIRVAGSYIFATRPTGVTSLAASTRAASRADFPPLGPRSQPRNRRRHFFTPYDLMTYGFNPVLPAFPKPGDQWKSTRGSRDFSVFGVTGTTRVRGITRVKTPAGTFRALLVESKLTQRGFRFGSGTRLSWFAPGEGLVKLRFRHGDGSVSTVERVR